MIEGLTFIENFWNDNLTLYERLVNEVNWNKEMKSRWTASFGQRSNRSISTKELLPMWPDMQLIGKAIEAEIGYLPNNCFLNYYFEGPSRMGYHADTTVMLEEGTGVAIFSLGAERVFRVRSIENREEIHNYPLSQGSLIYMTNEMQTKWQHGIPKSKVEAGRISMTFRRMIV